MNSVKDENLDRVNAYQKNKPIEDYLLLANRELSKIAEHCSVPGDTPKLPVVFVVGLQRSGTTLMMQLLSESFLFTYPNNLVARFWEAPFIGVIVSKSLQEKFKNQKDGSFASDYGVSSNMFGPHEFGYFWTKWFGFDPIHQLSEEQLNCIDVKGLKRSLFLMEHYGQLPLLFKVVPLGLNLDFIAHHFKKALFIYVKRDPLYVAQSTYLGRINRYGDENVWWSLKPQEFFELVKSGPIDQITGQVFYSQERIEKCLDMVPPSRQITIEYESLCKKPIEAIESLGGFFGAEISRQDKKIPDSFPNENILKCDKDIFERLQSSMEKLPWQCDGKGSTRNNS